MANEKHVHDEQCECGCEEDVVVLQDAEGNDVAFHHITTLEYEGKDYVFLQLANAENEEQEGFVEIFELQENEDAECDSLLAVDDELYDVLFAKLMEIVNEDGCGCGCEGDCDCEDGDCDCDGHHHHDGKCDCGCHHDEH